MSTRYSYGEFGCSVFADNARTYAYHLWACENQMYPDQCQPTMIECACPLDDGMVPPVDPATDPAPWYDPDDIASTEFLGAMILTADGTMDSTIKREVSDAFGDGSILNRARLTGRSIVFELLLLSTSCRGLDYGIEWLRRVFEREMCGCAPDPCDSCAGKRLTLRVECGDGTPCDTGLRSWESVGVVDGIKLVRDDALTECSCTAQKVSLTLQSEQPYSFSCENNVCNIPVDDDAFKQCIDWTSFCRDCCDTANDPCDRCGYDAGCSCFGNDPIPTATYVSDDCWCEPLERIVQSCCVDVSGVAYDTAIKLDIYSGFDFTGTPEGLAFTDLGLRHTRISLYRNPLNLPCITDQDTYEAWCAQGVQPDFELTIPYIPSNATLTIDGRTERILLDCDGRCRPFPYQVSNLKGSIFPLVTQCDPMMVVVEWDSLNVQKLSGPNLAKSVLNVTSFRRRLS